MRQADLINLSLLSEVVAHFFLEEVVEVRPLGGRLLPGRPLVVLGNLEDVLEVVEGEDPCALVEDEERQVVHLHVDLRGQPNLGPLFCQGQVLHDEKFVLQPHVL